VSCWSLGIKVDFKNLRKLGALFAVRVRVCVCVCANGENGTNRRERERAKEPLK